MRKKRRKRLNKKKKTNSITAFFRNIKNSFFDEVDDDLNSKTSFSIVEVILIVLISILFGIIIGYIITYSKSPVSGSKENHKVSEIVSTYNTILDNYYGKVDKDELGDAAIKGMLESLDDPYTNYMDSSTTTTFNDTVDGSFVGIGVVVQYEENGYNRVIEVYDNSPAKKAGIKEGDYLISVDGKNVKGLYGDDLTKLIRGKVGTKVVIKVKRGEEKKTITVKRSVIELKSVTSKVFDYENSKIGYINIDSFAANSFKQFEKALKKMEEKNIDGLVIDVRDNPGGHLKQTREILSLFFDKKTILYQIESKDKKKKIYSLNNKVKDYKVVVLANEGSASASEILVSCFMDNYDNAVIVGTKTYGKGSVQKLQTLSNGTSYKYTTEKWLTSKGKWINGEGVEPDVVVEQNDLYYEEPNFNNDNQLQEALSQFSK